MMGFRRIFITLAVASAGGLISCAAFKGTDATADADGGGSASAQDGGRPTAAQDSGACSIARCPMAEPSCHYDDFATPTCPADWTKAGTPPDSETFECTGGKLHIAADFTFDIFGTLSVNAPRTATVVHVSARLAIKDWTPAGAALKLNVGGGIVWFGAAINPKGRPILYPCTGLSACGTPPMTNSFETGVAEEHIYTFDISKSGVAISVDCATKWNLPGVAPDFTGSGFSITFGMTDAEPLDATLDDVRVSFE